MQLFDTHSHIQDAEFDGDRDAVLTRSREAGLVGLLVLGTDPANSQDAIALAEAKPSLLAAAGCHPHDAHKMNQASWAQLADIARHPRVAAIGEIGLDFYRNYSPQASQIAVFNRQLEIAAEIGKPVAIHCREAHETLLPLVQAWSQQLGGRLPDGRPIGVLHYFSGDIALGRRYLELGFLISIHTSVTHPKSTRLQEVARLLPLDALVLETDSPYGAPQSHRGRRNEPAYVAEAAAKVAELRGEDANVVAAATTENALRLLATEAVANAGSRASQNA